MRGAFGRLKQMGYSLSMFGPGSQSMMSHFSYRPTQARLGLRRTVGHVSILLTDSLRTVWINSNSFSDAPDPDGVNKCFWYQAS